LSRNNLVYFTLVTSAAEGNVRNEMQLSSQIVYEKQQLFDDAKGLMNIVSLHSAENCTNFTMVSGYNIFK